MNGENYLWFFFTIDIRLVFRQDTFWPKRTTRHMQLYGTEMVY